MNPLNQFKKIPILSLLTALALVAWAADAVRATISDFNGEGHPDYVLSNASTRQTAIWYLNNNVFVGGAPGPTLPAGWALVAIADFNGDGHPDYVLEAASTGQTAIWYLNNNVFVHGAYGPALPAPAAWTLFEVIVGLGPATGKWDYP
jgi:hypothetical protein